jgi:hypothetical protein
MFIGPSPTGFFLERPIREAAGEILTGSVRPAEAPFLLVPAQ